MAHRPSPLLLTLIVTEFLPHGVSIDSDSASPHSLHAHVRDYKKHKSVELAMMTITLCHSVVPEVHWASVIPAVDDAER